MIVLKHWCVWCWMGYFHGILFYVGRVLAGTPRIQWERGRIKIVLKQWCLILYRIGFLRIVLHGSLIAGTPMIQWDRTRVYWNNDSNIAWDGFLQILFIWKSDSDSRHSREINQDCTEAIRTRLYWSSVSDIVRDIEIEFRFVSHGRHSKDMMRKIKIVLNCLCCIWCWMDGFHSAFYLLFIIHLCKGTTF